jgi:IclR family transcriptional regulator, KDG regulon repressor
LVSRGREEGEVSPAAPEEDIAEQQESNVGPRYSVQVIQDAAGILGCFGTRNTPLGVSELGKAVGLGRSKVHRILDTLRYVGFVEQDEVTKKYRLGLRMFELAAAAGSRFDLGAEARQALQELVEITSETVNVGVLRGREVLYVDSVMSNGPLRLEVEVGYRAPATCVALGKAMLAFESPEFIERYLAGPLPRVTQNSITDPERLREELHRSREQGFAVDDEEAFPGMRCIAVPIFDRTGSAAAAIAMSGPAARLPMSRLLDLLEPMRETARRISQQPTE